MGCSEALPEVWRWRGTLEIFLLFLSLSSGSSSSSSGLPRQYTQYRLDKRCGLKINLGKKPGVFVFSGPPDDQLECEVQIRAASPAYGLNVFMEELKLHSAPDCSADFLQFGR